MDQFSEDITSSQSTPAASYVFGVDEDSVALPKKDAETFHNITAKLMFVCLPKRTA